MTRAAIGIIPAYAGSTLKQGLVTARQAGSSPHTRGALCRKTWATAICGGHPRIRGEHVIHALGGGSVRGIIPAYAGSTSIELPGAADKAGSSPHTRGTRARAYASSSSCRDHPRIRGEHDVATVGGHNDDGIIPAYAGNTMISSQSWVPVPGSSPHTRGTLKRGPPGGSRRGEHVLESDLPVDLHGIIPAYAGNTLCSLGFVCGSGDHPRIRGEHQRAILSVVFGFGIIPAYAGNTECVDRLTMSVLGSSPHTRGTPCRP